MANGAESGGLEPVRACEEPARPFFPVSARERTICLLLACVTAVAVYSAFNALPDLLRGIQDSSSIDPGVQIAESDGFSSSGGGKIDGGNGEVPIIRGDDGREYYDFNRYVENDESASESATVNELPSVSGKFEKGSDESIHASDWRDQSFLAQFRGGVYPENERVVHEDTRYWTQSGVIQSGELLRYEPVDAGEPLAYQGAERRFANYNGIENRFMDKWPCEQNVRRFDTCGISTGYYRFNDSRNNSLHLANLGNVGKWVASTAVGRKLTSLMMIPLFSFAVQTGAMTVMDETLAKEAPAIEIAMAETMSNVVARTMTIGSQGVVASEAEMSVVVADVMASNAARGITMTESELAAEAVSRANTLESGGAGLEFFTDKVLNDLAKGMVACEDLPFLAQIGQTLLEMGAYEASAFGDAEGFTSSGGGELPSVYSNDATLSANTVVLNYDATFRNGISVEMTNKSKIIWSISSSGGYSNIEYAYSEIGGNVYSGNYQKVKPDSVHWTLGPGVSISKLNDGFTGNQLKMMLSAENYHSSVENDNLSANAGTAENFFNNGGQLVGNDAQYGDNGEILDSGHADITPALYDDGFNPQSWLDALNAGGVHPIQPQDPANPSAYDEVVTGPEEGEPVGEVTGPENGGGGGDPWPEPPTLPRAKFNLDGTMVDVGNKIQGKFPFCLPANILALVNLFNAPRVAPRIEWPVFNPADGGTDLIVVDLSEFEPVAVVLRFMLDVLFVFLVIKLASRFFQSQGQIGGD